MADNDPEEVFAVVWRDRNGAFHKIPCTKNTCLLQMVRRIGVNDTARQEAIRRGIDLNTEEYDIASVDGHKYCTGCERNH